MTVREALSALPAPYNSAALRYAEASTPAYLDTPVEKPEHAVMSAFIWDSTAEGNDFWSGVYQALKTGTPLPPYTGEQATH